MIDEADFVKYITIKKALAPLSVRHCTIRIRVVNRWLESTHKELTKSTIEEFLYFLRSEKHLSPNTLNSYIFCLRYIENYLKDRGEDVELMTGIISFPKQRLKQIEILTPDEIERYLSVDVEYKPFRGKSCERLNTMYKTLSMALAYTGARFDEMVSITCKQVDLSWGKITFLNTKNKESRSVFITEPLTSRLAELMEGREREDLIFTTMTGHKIHPQDFQVDIQKRSKLAKITKHIHPHLFRHSFATQLIISGVDITQVASILGHKDIQTTYQNYVHLADESLKKAMYHHPLIRKHIEAIEFLTAIKQSLLSYKIEQDTRFSYFLQENNHELIFKLKIK